MVYGFFGQIGVLIPRIGQLEGDSRAHKLLKKVPKVCEQHGRRTGLEGEKQWSIGQWNPMQLDSWTSVLFIQLVGLTDHEPNGLGPSAPEENLGADFWGFLAPSKANFWGLLAIDLGA